MKPLLNTRHCFFITGKGIETSSGNLLSVIYQQGLGRSTCITVLPGLTFATEVARKLPLPSVLTSQLKEFAPQLQKTLHKPWF